MWSFLSLARVSKLCSLMMNCCAEKAAGGGRYGFGEDGGSNGQNEVDEVQTAQRADPTATATAAAAADGGRQGGHPASDGAGTTEGGATLDGTGTARKQNCCRQSAPSVVNRTGRC